MRGGRVEPVVPLLRLSKDVVLISCCLWSGRTVAYEFITRRVVDSACETVPPANSKGSLTRLRGAHCRQRSVAGSTCAPRTTTLTEHSHRLGVVEPEDICTRKGRRLPLLGASWSKHAPPDPGQSPEPQAWWPEHFKIPVCSLSRSKHNKQTGLPLVTTKLPPAGARWKTWLNLRGLLSPSVCKRG